MPEQPKSSDHADLVAGQAVEFPVSVASPRATSRTEAYVEVYRITAEFLSKLALPAVLVFVVLLFRPTVASLLSRTTEAEIAGAKLKFAEALNEAIKGGDIKKVEAVVQRFTKEAASDVLRSFWKPDGNTTNVANQQVLRAWMDANGLSGQSITMFLYGQEYASVREKAVRDLNLANR